MATLLRTPASARAEALVERIGDAPLLAVANAFALWRAAMHEGRDAAPFVLTLTFFALGFAGLVLGIWPNIIPPSMSIWDAASPPSSRPAPPCRRRAGSSRPSRWTRHAPGGTSEWR